MIPAGLGENKALGRDALGFSVGCTIHTTVTLPSCHRHLRQKKGLGRPRVVRMCLCLEFFEDQLHPNGISGKTSGFLCFCIQSVVMSNIMEIPGRSNSALPFPPSLKEEKGSALEPWLFVLRHFRNVHECAKAGFRRDIQVYTENNLRNTKDFLTYHIHRAWWRRWTSCSIMSGLMEVGGPTLNVGRTIDGQRPQTELKRRK
ncbi:uncharacterized protein LOC118239146 isoform X2 [Cricetulus griseus]|uniref:Uncharacterized protein LOC118239146 isoform X2 n=1 Tax=Cricetulus griseus TaxID=10029 RepID=A0A9J7H3H0_CRIGR|nr:uncharacterized protein LOC118239146 isoform X2 [Cricetulus griseus]